MSTLAQQRVRHPLTRMLLRGVNTLGPLLILAALAELVGRSGLLNKQVFPPFSDVLWHCVLLIQDGQIFPELGASLFRVVIGLALGTVVGVGVGLAMGLYPSLGRALNPLVTLAFTLPKSAIIPIIFLWLGVTDAADILVVFIAAVVPLIISAHQGAIEVPHNYIWSARSLGASRMHIVRTVIFPSALPHILYAFRMSLAFSIVVVISAEMIAAFIGIGQYIFSLGLTGNLVSMYAAILITVFVVFIIDRCVAAVEKYLLRWTDSEALYG